MITRRRLAAALIPLALLVGCTAEQTGAPTTPSVTPSFGAPSVPDPLDDDAFVADPCTSLTPEQQQEFGVDGGTERTAQKGPKCDYAGTDFVSALYSNDMAGLTLLYSLNEDGVWTYWEPTEIGGYPAVAYQPPSSQKTCEVAVGLSDKSYVSVGTEGPDACARATEWAGRVLETIKAGQ